MKAARNVQMKAARNVQMKAARNVQTKAARNVQMEAARNVQIIGAAITLCANDLNKEILSNIELHVILYYEGTISKHLICQDLQTN